MPAKERVAGTLTIDVKDPSNVGGRIRAIGIGKRNANIMIAGSVSSRVFRSIDFGANWIRVVASGQIHNLTAVAQDTRAGFEDTRCYGGGEASGNSASLASAYRGYGIWKSTDKGVTWA